MLPVLAIIAKSTLEASALDVGEDAARNVVSTVDILASADTYARSNEIAVDEMMDAEVGGGCEACAFMGLCVACVFFRRLCYTEKAPNTWHRRDCVGWPNLECENVKFDVKLYLAPYWYGCCVNWCYASPGLPFSIVLGAWSVLHGESITDQASPRTPTQRTCQPQEAAWSVRSTDTPHSRLTVDWVVVTKELGWL